MKKTDFTWLCSQYSINPSVALEDEGVKKILKLKGNSKNLNLIKQFALNTYFKNNF